MSNEEVVLNMVINRLEQLLEQHETLRSQWSAEIGEIVKLGQGVLKINDQQTSDGRWILYLTAQQVSMLDDMVYGAGVGQYPASEREPVQFALDDLWQASREEREGGLEEPPEEAPNEP